MSFNEVRHIRFLNVHLNLADHPDPHVQPLSTHFQPDNPLRHLKRHWPLDLLAFQPRPATNRVANFSLQFCFDCGAELAQHVLCILHIRKCTQCTVVNKRKNKF